MMQIPESVVQWADACSAAKREIDVSIETAVVLVQIWQESGGDASVGEDYADSGHFGLLQIGDLAAQGAADRLESIPDDVEAAWFDGRGRQSIRSYYAIQSDYDDVHDYEPILMWLLWASGPGAVKNYKRELERAGRLHPDIPTMRSEIKPFSHPVEYALEAFRKLAYIRGAFIRGEIEP